MIKSLLRRIVAATTGALVLVGTSASIASAAPLSWKETSVSGLALLDEIVLVPLGIAATIAVVAWTYLTLKDRAATKVPVRVTDKS